MSKQKISNELMRELPDKFEVTTGNYLTTVAKGKGFDGVHVTRRNNYLIPAIPLGGLVFAGTQLSGLGSRSKFFGLGAWALASSINSLITMNNTNLVFGIKTTDV